MNNEPLAWMGKDYDGLKTDLYFDVERNKLPYRLYESAIPLYTHPVKEPAICVGHWDYKTGAFHKVLTESQQKRVDEGFLQPVYTAGMLPVKDITDEEIYDILWMHFPISDKEKNATMIAVMTHCIKTALKKAQER